MFVFDDLRAGAPSHACKDILEWARRAVPCPANFRQITPIARPLGFGRRPVPITRSGRGLGLRLHVSGDLAAELEDDGELQLAAEHYRSVLAAAGPNAEVNFRLAELLYRMGDVEAARERYYTTIELDEDFVEARANLGCVLSETGQHELAVAAFEGALSYHGDYPDVHYHLARTLDELSRTDEAVLHWRAFLANAPDSPWADAARDRLGE